jgi:hypothetical protein
LIYYRLRSGPVSAQVQHLLDAALASPPSPEQGS